jgi:large subunit ribosomal protein L22
MMMKDYNKETMAKVTGRSLSISTKQSIEVCNFIRGKNLQKMKDYLKDVIDMKKAVKFTRFNKGLGHKKGIGPGRYPINTVTEILMLLESAESNAQLKGLNSANLIIGHINADKASSAWHYGRQRRRKMKRTNLNIILINQESNKNVKIKVNENKKSLESKKISKETAKKTEVKS